MKILLIFLLFSSSNSIKIECDFKQMSFELLSDRYTCEVISADFSENSTHITSSGGTHQVGFDNENVTMVFWSQEELAIVPKGFLSVFRGKFL
jgi:hypothetical protein